MLRRFATVCLGLAIALFLAVPLTVLAHDEITVGSYVFTIGWRTEPPVAGQMNGPYVFISTAEAHEAAHHSEGAEATATPEAGHDDGSEEGHAGAGVEGAEATLTFSVEYGGQKKDYALRPVFGEPGAYTTDFIPTRAGVYTFHFGGSINGETIALDFDPEEVGAANSLMFPDAGAEATAVSAAQAQAGMAQTIAIVAAVLGLVGIGVGGFSLARKK